MRKMCHQIPMEFLANVEQKETPTCPTKPTLTKWLTGMAKSIEHPLNIYFSLSLLFSNL